MITLAGRPNRKWQCKVTVRDGEVHFRFDDDRIAEFWMEMTLDADEWKKINDMMLEEATRPDEPQPVEADQQ